MKSCNNDEAEIKKALRILKQVVAKSKVKIQRLKKEAEMERQEKLARSARKKELAEKIQTVLAANEGNSIDAFL